MKTFKELAAERTVVEPSGCWRWTGYADLDGYGKVKVGGRRGRLLLAHRTILAETLGRELAPGECALHTCDHPRCVNPEHLWLGTKGDNTRDMVAKGRHHSQAHPELRPRGDEHWSRRNPELTTRGEANGSAKLTEVQVREIRQLYSEAWTQVSLSSRFGVSQSLISSIVRRTIWREI